MNRGVEADSIGGLSLKIKTVQSNSFIKTLVIDGSYLSSAIANRIANFTWPNIDQDQVFQSIKMGQHLKVQMAYIGKGANRTVGYYSTVGITKYTSKPNVYIENAADPNDANSILSFKQTYMGVYEVTDDVTERPYSYNFFLYDNKHRLLESSGWLLHNSIVNTVVSEAVALDKTLDQYTYITPLEDNSEYFIQYGVRTINNLEIYSPLYPCYSSKLRDPNLLIELKAENNFDEAYIKLHFDLTNGATVLTNLAEPVSLEISRATQMSGFTDWRPIKKAYFVSYSELANFELKDFSIEQGIVYKYCYRQYNENYVYSNRMLSNSVKADFEDMFLYDGINGDKQLKIRFNPKISSFKSNQMEQKMETIGNKYPFIFKNGIINYKEFPISGLISYNADNEELFLNKLSDLGIQIPEEAIRENGPASFTGEYEYQFILVSEGTNYNPSQIYYYKSSEMTDYEQLSPFSVDNSLLLETWNTHVLQGEIYTRELLPGYEEPDLKAFSTLEMNTDNMRAERIFKMKTLEWLTNGQVKLFKSPAEGNYLVRLMNVSLTPEDKLGRMLHTFNATAYEVEELTYSNLVSLQFIRVDEPLTKERTTATISFSEKIGSEGTNRPSVKINDYDILDNFWIELSPSTSGQGSSFYVRLGSDNPANKVFISGGLQMNVEDSKLPDIYFNYQDNLELMGGTINKINAQGVVKNAVLHYTYVINQVAYGQLYNIDNVYVKNRVQTFIGPTTINFGEVDVTDTSLNAEEHILKFFVLEFKRKDSSIKLYTNGTKFYDNNNRSREYSVYNPLQIYQVVNANGDVHLYESNDAGTALSLLTNSNNKHTNNNFFTAAQVAAIVPGTITLKTSPDDSEPQVFNEPPVINLDGATDYKIITMEKGVYLNAAYQARIITYTGE